MSEESIEIEIRNIMRQDSYYIVIDQIQYIIFRVLLFIFAITQYVYKYYLIMSSHTIKTEWALP